MKLKVSRYRSISKALVIFAGFGAHANSVDINDSLALRQSLSVDSIRKHQGELQKIATANKGTRFVGTEGYKASVAYIESQLKAAGYEVTRQDFPLGFSENNSDPILEKTSPEKYSFQADQDFSVMNSLGTIEISGSIEAVDLKIPSPSANSSTSGCEPSDFKNFTAGNIALIQRGVCSFQQKVDNARAAHASGVIIFNEGNPGRTGVITGRLRQTTDIFPILGASFEVGEKLGASVLKGPTGNGAHLKIDVIEKKHIVQNLIAQTAKGDENRVVVVGSHLDSVVDGPGLNDNGSGSSTILAIAEKYAELGIEPKNKVRFIWFAAEELGLLGSEHYVDTLLDEEKNQILAMLNFDMLNSSNYARFVYDGDRSSEGSGYIEKIFLDYFSAIGLVNHPTSFDGRSDYGPFIEVGIPAGGLFSGAEGLKSARFAEIYGGIAHAPYDPCYHRRCDDFAHTGGDPTFSLALKSLDELSDAAAHAVLRLSNTDANIHPPLHTTQPPKVQFDYRGNYLVR